MYSNWRRFGEVSIWGLSLATKRWIEAANRTESSQTLDVLAHLLKMTVDMTKTEKRNQKYLRFTGPAKDRASVCVRPAWAWPDDVVSGWGILDARPVPARRVPTLRLLSWSTWKCFKRFDNMLLETPHYCSFHRFYQPKVLFLGWFIRIRNWSAEKYDTFRAFYGHGINICCCWRWGERGV